MPDYIAMTFKAGRLPDYTPSMGGGEPERFHNEKSLMTFLRKCVEQGILVPVERGDVFDWCFTCENFWMAGDLCRRDHDRGDGTMVKIGGDDE